jgi:hypothetical protein
MKPEVATGGADFSLQVSDLSKPLDWKYVQITMSNQHAFCECSRTPSGLGRLS